MAAVCTRDGNTRFRAIFIRFFCILNIYLFDFGLLNTVY